jgi:uncharacterized iron-regulated membrane protein
MKTFRKIIFWLHLTVGVVAGTVIFIMSVTGALLAFEKNITEFAEREQRVVAPQENARKLSVLEILAKVREAKPDTKFSSVSLQNAPNAAWQVGLGRDGQIFVNPFTGEITGEGAKGVRGVFRGVTDWHRWLAVSGDNRPIAKSVTGACNLAFLFLAISGVYIWMPRRFSWRHFAPVLWFRRGLRGRARNFNWHNVIGFWSSLVLIVLTVTASVISYQWAGNLVYTLTGNEVPQQQQQQNQNQQNEQADILPENINELWTRAEKQTENPKAISLRLPVAKDAVFTIDEGRYWNRFGRSTLTLNPQSGEIAKWESYGEQNSGRQLRLWMRFTHTGETGGFVGQLIGFIACISGAFLVWTGFSLALRRFRNRRGETLKDSTL